jgi:hypothetical protein
VEKGVVDKVDVEWIGDPAEHSPRPVLITSVPPDQGPTTSSPAAVVSYDITSSPGPACLDYQTVADDASVYEDYGYVNVLATESMDCGIIAISYILPISYEVV